MSWSGQSIRGTAGVSRARSTGVPVRPGVDGNAARQRRAAAKLSEVELATGKSPEWWEAFHAEQRARVLKRFGVKS